MPSKSDEEEGRIPCWGSPSCRTQLGVLVVLVLLAYVIVFG